MRPEAPVHNPGMIRTSSTACSPSNSLPICGVLPLRPRHYASPLGGQSDHQAAGTSRRHRAPDAHDAQHESHRGGRTIPDAGGASDRPDPGGDGRVGHVRAKAVRTAADQPAACRLLYLPAPILTSFADRYPDITLELCFEDGQSDIVGSGFDAGIRLSDILVKDTDRHEALRPGALRDRAAAPGDISTGGGRLQAIRKTCSPTTASPPASRRPALRRLGVRAQGQGVPVQVKGSLIFNDSSLITRAAIDGMGVIYTAEDAIRDEVRSKHLEIVLTHRTRRPARAFYLYYPSQSQALPKLRPSSNT